MAPSARAWAVSKLKALNFEGDADALGQYVDALIENNRETENADPTLLRNQVSADLNDFLEPPAAKEFVDSLMLHLSPVEGGVKQTTDKTPEKPSVRSAANDDRLMGALGERRISPGDKKQKPVERERKELPERDREHRQERDRNERYQRNDRGDWRDRHDRADRPHHERKENDVKNHSFRGKPNIIARLGDRIPEPDRRSPPERGPQVRLPNQTWDMRDDRQRRNPLRRGERPMDLRDRLGTRAKRPRDDDTEREVKMSRRGEPRDTREYKKRGEDDMQGLTRSGGRPDDAKPPGPWPPEMMGRMPMIPPPLPFGMMPPPPMMGPLARGDRGTPRGRDVRDRGGRNNNAQNSRYKHFILIAKFIPEDKMMIGPIYAYFQRFGSLRDVQRIMPDKAFIMFERREEAQRALNSVDAVMGNRHVRLFWARDQDFTEAGMTLSDDGTLQQSDQGTTTPQKVRGQRDGMDTRTARNTFHLKREQAAAEKEERAKLAEEERERKLKAAEEDLKKKKEQIAALRKEQDERKAERQAKYNALLGKQKKLMDEINASNDAQEKVTLMRQWKLVLAETEGVLAELKPKPVKQAPAVTHPARRNPSSFKVDNRPKNVLISNAKPEVTQELAVAVFRETERAERKQGGWLLCFSTRWAAESALRAVGPLKRGFGQQATAQIVTMTLPDNSVPVANTASNPRTVNPVEVRPQTIAE